MTDHTDKLLETKNKGMEFVRNRAFDLISVGIIVAMTALSLGAMELRDISVEQFADIILECIPFYLAATMLSANYYTKGTYAAKVKDVYINSVKYYSEQVSNLTGKHMNYLPEFCSQYNKQTLQDMQKELLNSVAITWERYDEGTSNSKPLKVLSKREIINLLGRECGNVVHRCKRLKIKGIYPNVLLGNLNKEDRTNLGLTEQQLAKRRLGSYAIGYVVSIFFMSLIGMKDVMQWGWMGMFLTLFKILYITCRAVTKYYNGYEDISTHVVNYNYRKSDIIKEFYYWYECLNKTEDFSENAK